MPAPALERFSPVTRAWFEATFDGPTPAQEQGWAAISEGEHTLVLAPTGSGKTLAAFLWCLDRLLTTGPPQEPGRCKVVYISPLKALTYDVERNLRAPLAGLALEAGRLGLPAPAISVATRTGDTPQAERRDLVRHPPDILITTPESLYLMLTSSARTVLAGVEHVIVDEIHSVAGTKRGAHLALSLERLERLTDRPPQRIGLSATQRPLDEIARFLGGRHRDPATGEWRPRPVTVVDAGVRKPLEIEVVVPVEDMSELGKPIDDGQVMSGPAAGQPEARHSIWPAIHPVLLDLIEAHRSTLIFVNSRRLAERLAARLNDLAGRELVRAHHGSVAREQRLEIEDALKAGSLPALVATSSLELGIDMGAIDLVVQVESPTSVASGLQRIGRAGHKVGEPSRGRIFPKFRGDLVEAAVVVMRMKAALIEETRVPRNPLDVLAQQIVAMCAVEDVTVDDVAEVAAGAYPFADCTPALLEGVLDMLAGRYPSADFAELRPRLTWDRVEGTLRARAGARMLAVTSGGTIPDRGLYGVFTPGADGKGGVRVGELDEEMVYESRVGETFVLGASTWRIEEITRDRVIVTPAPGEPGKMPFWHGDGLGRPAELGRAVGAFQREVDGWSDERLAEECSLDPLAVQNLRAYLAEERSVTGALPTDRQVVVERFRDELGDWRICVLSPLGGRVHAPWALAIEAKVRSRLGLEVQTMWSDEGVVVRLPEADESPPVESILLEPEEVEDLVVAELANSALFAARFRENAARALLLPRRRPGSRTPLWQQRQRAADLLAVASRHGSFPVLLETYRECLRDVFDLPALVELMTAVRARTVRVVSVDTARPSPFASSLAFAYVANFLYEGDAPLAERRAQALTLDREMLAELLGAEELRELIHPEALDALEADLQCLDERRWARDADEASDLLRRLGDLTREELRARSTADFADALVSARRAVEVRVAGEPRLVLAEDAGRYRDALGVVPPPGVPDAFLEPVHDALASLLGRWARTHGPFTTDEPAARFGLPAGAIEGLLARRADAGLLLRGEFRPSASVAERGGRTSREWCDPDVLRSLRQRSLSALRKEVEPVDSGVLARFLPAWQGVGSEATGIERLHEVVAQLQGVAVPASVLERDVLSARVSDYSPRLLDELAAAGEVVWVGAGPLGTDDGKVVLFLRERAAALRPPLPVSGADRPSEEPHERLRQALARRGACFFRELAAAVGSDDKVALEALWDLVWAGEVTNDSFSPLRALAGGGRPGRPKSSRRRGRPNLGSLTVLGPPRAQGRWSLVDADLSADAVSPTERAHALAAVLLDRHGVLTREAVRGEGHAGGFAAVYPVLRAMEESGRVRRGYFVAGMGGAQFALPGAVDRLRARRDAGGDEAKGALVLAATDPAHAYGLTLPWPVPGLRRVAGAYVVLVDGEGALYVERGGRGLVALRPFDGRWEDRAVAALDSLVASGRARRLAVERYDETLEPVLRAAGFVPSPRGLVRYG
ncbi:MAG TPA: DEAD/DEAH box helicase [Acidimicrobiales bacterium]|nr:DEAD/DEAH box helicase [Acidimicrobiales bacterium]